MNVNQALYHFAFERINKIHVKQLFESFSYFLYFLYSLTFKIIL